MTPFIFLLFPFPTMSSLETYFKKKDSVPSTRNKRKQVNIIVSSNEEEEEEGKSLIKLIHCVKAPSSSSPLKLVSHFHTHDFSCSFQVGKWPRPDSGFEDPVECYKEIKHKLEINPKVVLAGGKEGRQSRDIAFFSNVSQGYTYTQQTQTSFPLTERMQNLINQVNGAMGTDFDSILVNRYKNGRDNMISEHQDQEAAYEPAGVFAISMFPEPRNRKVIKAPTRTFRLKSDPLVENKVVFTIPNSLGTSVKTYPAKPAGKDGHRDWVYDLRMGHLDVCWMQGDSFQRRFYHSIPLEAGIVDPRVSFTFRKLKPT